MILKFVGPPGQKDVEVAWRPDHLPVQPPPGYAVACSIPAVTTPKAASVLGAPGREKANAKKKADQALWGAIALPIMLAEHAANPGLSAKQMAGILSNDDGTGRCPECPSPETVYKFVRKARKIGLARKENESIEDWRRRVVE
jgi:hypothetical protein